MAKKKLRKKQKKAKKKPVRRKAKASRARAGKPVRKAAKRKGKKVKARVTRAKRGKPAPKKTKKPVRKTPVKPLEPGMTPEKQVPGGVFLGLVEDYFGHVGVAALTLKSSVSLGDMIRVKGHTTDITQKVESMQIQHESVQTAMTGSSVGIKIADKTRKGDAIYKIL